MTRENLRAWLTGVAWVVAIFGGLIGMLSLVTGRAPAGDGSERRVYRSVDGHELALWIYRPGGWRPDDHRPVVLWFFGGGFEVGIPSQFAKQAEAMAEEGLVAMTVDYRVRSRHGSGVTPFDAVDDARAALRWVREHAAELGIDAKRIAVAGGSSGGLLAAMCAIHGAGGEESPLEPPNALLLFNPAVDLDIPIVRERTNEEELASLMAISPLQQLREPLPPTLLLHGVTDDIVPVEGSRAFVAKAREQGASHVEFMEFPGQGHEFYLPIVRGGRGYEASNEKVRAFLLDLGWMEN